MLSSSDVAQMFAAQNQMFMGQNQFAQQIGVSNPSLSLSAWGTDPRQKAFGAQGTFGGHSPVSYAQSGMGGPGYGGGTRYAGGAMSLMGGVASAGIGIMSNPLGAFVGGMGHGGSAFGQLVGAGRGAGMIGGMVGGGIAGGALAAGASMLPAYLAQKAIGAYVGGGQEQQGIQSALGGFGFQSGRSRTGQGFSRDDAQMIGNQVRSIAHIPEMMTSVEELTKLIPKLKGTGMMAGANSASEFNSRFKEAVKTLRDVSKVLGTSMEEATQFFEHSRSVGMLGKKDQVQNAMNVQFTAAQTGMSTQQVMQLQSSGAQMAVGRGVRRSTGATAVTNMAQQFGRAMQSGNVSQSDLEDMTGVPGEAAVGAASQQMVEKLARFAESTSAGKASMMGLAEFDDKGRYKGINKELAQKYARGEVSKEDLMKRIGTFTGQQKIAASRKVGSMAIEFAGATGPGGAMNFMTNVLAEGGHTGESAKFMMQKYGFSEVEVDIMSQMQGMQGGGEDRQKKAFERKKKMEADISDRTDPSKIMARLGTKLKSASGYTKAEQAGSEMFTSMGKAYDEYVDELVGRYSIELSEKGAQRLRESLNTQKGREDMKAMFAMKAPRYTVQGSATGGGKLLALGMGMMTGGASLIGQGGINAGGKMFDKMGKDLMNMVGGSNFEGAGDAQQQRDYVQDSFGMKGKDSGAINDRFKQLRGMGEGEDGAKGQVQDVIAKLNKDSAYRDASQADRLKMLSEALEGEEGHIGFHTSRFASGKVSKVQAFMKKNNLKNMAEAAMALTDKEDLTGDFNDVEASIRDTAMSHADSIKGAEVHMNDVMGDKAGMVVSAAIASDAQIGQTLFKALDDPAIAKILKKAENDKEGARALAKALGRPEGSISEEEFKKTREAHDKIDGELADISDPVKRAEKKKEMQLAVVSRTMAEVSKDIAVTQTVASDLAADMDDSEMKAALKDFASEKNASLAHQKQFGLRDVAARGAEKLIDAKKEFDVARKASEADPKNVKKKEAAQAAADKLKGISKGLGGEMSGRIMQASSEFDKDIKERGRGKGDITETLAEASKEFGIDEKSLAAALGMKEGGDQSIKLDKATLAKIKATSIGQSATTGVLVASPEKKKEAADEHLKKTLDSIDGNIAKTNTLIATMGVFGMSKEDAEKAYGKPAESTAAAKVTNPPGK